MRIVWGIIGIIIGFLIIKYTFPLVGIFGKIAWAEQHLGGAGTYTLYKIIGIVVIVLSMLYMFNAIGFLISPLAPLFGGR